MDINITIKCKKHPNKQASFIYIDQKNKTLENACNQCSAQKYNSQNSIPLVLDELFSKDQQTILTNWPILQNNDLLIRYTSFFEEFKNNKTKISDQFQQINVYFNSIIDKFTSKIRDIEKQILKSIIEFSSEELLNTYNQISQREQLLQYINDQNNMEQNLKNLIVNSEKNCKKNERILEQQFSKYEKLSSILNEENMKNHIEKVFKILDEIDCKFDCNSQNDDVNEDQIQEEIDEQQNPEEISFEQKSQEKFLRKQALQFNGYWERLNEEFQSSQDKTYYLVSKNWLEVWKKHVSYDRVINGQQVIYQHFAKQGDYLFNANMDLIQTIVQYSEDEYYENPDNTLSGTSIILKSQLQENIDYVIVDKDIVNLFENIYKDFKLIPRSAYITSQGQKRIDIYYRQISLVIINHGLLKDIDNIKVRKLTKKKILTFSSLNQQELKDILIPIVKKHQYKECQGVQSSIVNLQNIKLWKLNENDNIDNIFSKIFTYVRNYTSFEYKFKSPLAFIDQNNDSTLDDLNINEGSTIFVEIQKNFGWTLQLE